MRRTSEKLLKFPARCADVLCHENLFPMVSRKLEKQVTELQITRESYPAFKTRVINTFHSLPIDTVNKIISSIHKRILQLIAVIIFDDCCNVIQLFPGRRTVYFKDRK